MQTTHNNAAIHINAEAFPTWSTSKDTSTEHPVDAAIRLSRETFLLNQCDRIESALLDLAHDVVTGNPDMLDKARAIIGKSTSA